MRTLQELRESGEEAVYTVTDGGVLDRFEDVLFHEHNLSLEEKPGDGN